MRPHLNPTALRPLQDQLLAPNLPHNRLRLGALVADWSNPCEVNKVNTSIPSPKNSFAIGHNALFGPLDKPSSRNG